MNAWRKLLGQGASLKHLRETGSQASSLLVPAAELQAGGSCPLTAFRFSRGAQPPVGKGKGQGKGKGKGARTVPSWSPYNRSDSGKGMGRNGPINIYKYY